MQLFECSFPQALFKEPPIIPWLRYLQKCSSFVLWYPNHFGSLNVSLSSFWNPHCFQPNMNILFNRTRTNFMTKTIAWYSSTWSSSTGWTVLESYILEYHLFIYCTPLTDRCSACTTPGCVVLHQLTPGFVLGFAFTTYWQV